MRFLLLITLGSTFATTAHAEYEYALGGFAFAHVLAQSNCSNLGPEWELATWETEADLDALLATCTGTGLSFCFTQYRTLGGAHLSILDDSPMPPDYGKWFSPPFFTPGTSVMARSAAPVLSEVASSGDVVCSREVACPDGDGDGVCDVDDVCPGDDTVEDADGDGVCGAADVCDGDDATGDTDLDGVCNDIDACQGDDASGDSDGDGTCDDLDVEACNGIDDNGNGGDDELGVCACQIRQYDAHDYAYCRRRTTATVARQVCQQLRMDLATIDDAAEDAWIDTTTYAAARVRPWWIGYTDYASEGSFYWASGSSSTFEDFRPGEPNASNAWEDCVVVYPLTGAWYDVGCNNRTSFVCEAP